MAIRVHKGIMLLTTKDAVTLNKVMNLTEVKKLYHEKISPLHLAFLNRDRLKLESILRKEALGFENQSDPLEIIEDRDKD